MYKFKKLCVIVLGIIFMVLIGNKECYANKLSDMINQFETSNTDHVGTFEQINGRNTIWDSNQNYFCIERDSGASSTTGTTNYWVTGFFKISKNGLDYHVWQTGSHSLHRISWEDIPNYEFSAGITKKIYYILSADDSKYGTYYEDYSNNKVTVPSNDGSRTFSVSQKQYALWICIDEFLKSYGIIVDAGTSAANQVDNCQCELLNKAKSNWRNINPNNMEKEVYLWVYDTYETVQGRDKFWQKLILAGHTTTPVINDKTYVKILKKEKEYPYSTISGAGFALIQISSDGTRTVPQAGPTDGSGTITFSNLDFSKYNYQVFEYAAASGYNLFPMNVEGKTSSNGSFIDGNGKTWNNLPYFSLNDSDKEKTIVVKNTKSQSKCNIKVIKKDKICNHPLSGAKFKIKDNTTGYYLENGKEWDLPSEGRIVEGLYIGHSYTIEETQVPSNHTCNGATHSYQTKTSKTIILSSNDKDKTVEVILYNEPIKGEISIKKVYKDSNGEEKPLSGVSFDLIAGDYTGSGGDYTTYKGLDGKTKTVITDENGTATFDNLELRKYTIRETNTTDIAFKRNIGKLISVELTSAIPKKVWWSDNNLKITNITYGGLGLTKQDRYSNNPLAGVGFKLYNKNNEKVYTLADTDSQGKTSSSSNLGRNSSITVSNEYGVNINTLYTIEAGQYELYEYKNPNQGYDVKYQGQYYVEGKGAYIGDVTINKGKIKNINDLQYTYNNPNTNKQESIYYNNNEPFGNVYIYKYIEKLKNNTMEREPLEGAKFKLYQGDKVVKLRNATSSGYIEEFESKLNAEGKAAEVAIERIPKGTYEIYETYTPRVPKNPDDPIYASSLTIQPGYDSSKKAAKIATIIINEKGELSVQLVEDNKYIVGHKYRDANVRRKNKHIADIYDTNRDYIKISGYIWEDTSPNTKNAKIPDNIYTANSDKRLEGIKVVLLNINKNGGKIEETKIEETTSDSSGNYKFQTLLNTEDLYNGDYYIEFDYSEYDRLAKNLKEYKKDGKYLYCAVSPNFEGINTSKAISNEMIFDDNNFFGNATYGKAYTGYRIY